MRDIFKILNLKDKKRFFVLIFMMIIASILEMLGISLIIPIILSLSNQNIFDKYPFLEKTNHLLNYQSSEELVIISITLLGAIYIIKNLYFVLFHYVESRILASTLEKKSQKLFSIYINRPYNFHLNTNTSEFVNRFRIDLPALRSSLLAFSNIFTEIFILIGIVSFLIIYNPKVFLLVFFLVSFFSIIFFVFFKKFFKKLGFERQITENIRSKTLQETFAAIKEIKVSKLEKFFYFNYEKISEKLKINFANVNFFNSLPKIYFETLAILILIFIVFFVLFFSNIEIDNFLTILGVFAGAAFKFLPSANRLISSFNRLRYNSKSIIELKKDLDRKSNLLLENIKSFKFIELNEINFNYGKKKVFEGLNLKIKANDKIFIYGDTGSGKSTLMDILLGLKKTISGKVIINNKDYSKSFFSFGEILGYVPQSVFLFDETIKNNITLFNNDIEKGYLKKCIEYSKLSKFVESLKDGHNSLVGQNGIKISGGQKQRIGIAREIFKNPKVILFDESTNSLDKKTEKEFLEDFLKFYKDKTVIFISHNQDLKKYFDQVFKIENFKIIKE